MKIYEKYLCSYSKNESHEQSRPWLSLLFYINVDHVVSFAYTRKNNISSPMMTYPGTR